MRRLVVALLGLALAGAATIVPAAPANATIHEIVAQWCAGKGELKPPGIQDGKNFAQPVFSNGFIGPVVPFDPPGAQPAGQLITFNYDSPSAKVVGTGVYVNIGDPAAPLYVEVIALDTSFAAFRNCPHLSTP